MALMAVGEKISEDEVSATYAIFVEMDSEPTWTAKVSIDQEVPHQYEGAAPGARVYSMILHLARKRYRAEGTWPQTVSFMA